MNERSEYIKSIAVEVGEILGYEYWIVPHKGLNGYVVFKERPVKEVGYCGILTYVPVHGGITYADDGVYGFDVGHCDSDEFPIHDREWVKGEIEKMILGIQRAAEVEAKYLRCTTNKGKAKHADYVMDGSTDFNLGVAINLLTGTL